MGTWGKMAGREASIGGVVGDVRVGDTRTVEAAGHSLSGSSRGLRRLLPFLGPAFIACVAYVDPGNFATNIQGGAEVRLPAGLGHRRLRT